jgi:pyruvate/2-oxoglutarate/acetoin dehydrogenase E1 component
MKYFDELSLSMKWLGEQPNTIFIGQAVGCPGTAHFNTLKYVPQEKRVELPVAEEFQMGMSLGLSLSGFIPISIFPRWNFLILAMNQLVNHLDKYQLVSDYRPKVIIKTAIGSERPLNPQPQHIGDFTNSVKGMLKNIKVIRLDEPEQIFEAYKNAYEQEGSTILVEWGDFYNEK